MKLDKRRKEFFRVIQKDNEHVELECDTYEEALDFCRENQLNEASHSILKFSKRNKDVQFGFFFIGDTLAGAVIRNPNDPGFVATVGGRVTKGG